MTPFRLDARLAADTLPVCDLPLSSVRLMDDANYPWLVLVPRRDGLEELLDLDAQGRCRLMEEIALAAGTLRATAPCDKLNVAALGNQVAQLHVHVIARSKGDPAWPRPVWGAVPARPYDAAGRDALVAGLRSRLLSSEAS
jgi:diadenosine tetraphosphate (Ap4A) HIT family hydrolase